ncbi:hypothetical protein AAIH25_20665 [Arthrobacter crystallopoietes]|uniref:hypothetical protein n=1 Tax=Crystallibacter crystallopoietes TaxID=37928 RepID=UPI003D1CA886
MTKAVAGAEGVTMEPSRLARAHGAFNLLFGLWPLLHYRSFEAASGPKTDHWLVKTVGGLMTAAGYAQFRAPASPDGRAIARRIGLGTAATFIIVDLRYVSRGRISRIYLLDAVLEMYWLIAWAADLAMARKLCSAKSVDSPKP